MLAVERRSCVRGDIDRPQRLAARRVERVQLVASSEPDVLAVIRDAMHLIGTGEGPVLTNDFCL